MQVVGAFLCGDGDCLADCVEDHAHDGGCCGCRLGLLVLYGETQIVEDVGEFEDCKGRVL